MGKKLDEVREYCAARRYVAQDDLDLSEDQRERELVQARVDILGEIIGVIDSVEAGYYQRAVINPVPAESENYFTDPRDGRRYRTVRMPDGKVWMAENLDYETPEGSWCYGDDPANGAKYGRLYTWEAANAAVPPGWRLPTREEWAGLVAACGGDEAGKRLKATSGWKDNGNGTDDFGFSALPGGFNGSGFGNAGYYGYWWTATEFGSGFAYYRYMNDYCDYVYESDYYKAEGFSVRCVRDRDVEEGARG
jgi:uncharacterized protein (TIGR02145 family)